MKYIELSRGFKTAVDDEEYKQLNEDKWYAHTDSKGFTYAVRTVWVNGKHSMVRMHRIILNAPKGSLGDHINGDTLDNQKHNLRLVTCQQNSQNRIANKNSTSKFMGVSWNSRVKRWATQITHNRKHFWLGFFDDEKVAAKIYNEKAKELFGDFAKLNFV